MAKSRIFEDCYKCDNRICENHSYVHMKVKKDNIIICFLEKNKRNIGSSAFIALSIALNASIGLLYLINNFIIDYWYKLIPNCIKDRVKHFLLASVPENEHVNSINYFKNGINTLIIFLLLLLFIIFINIFIDMTFGWAAKKYLFCDNDKDYVTQKKSNCLTGLISVTAYLLVMALKNRSLTPLYGYCFLLNFTMVLGFSIDLEKCTSFISNWKEILHTKRDFDLTRVLSGLLCMIILLGCSL